MLSTGSTFSMSAMTLKADPSEQKQWRTAWSGAAFIITYGELAPVTWTSTRTVAPSASPMCLGPGLGMPLASEAL